jgi:outer membrane protein insertion porin family
VSSLTLQGVTDENLGQVQALLQSSEGQPYSDLNVATDQNNILNYYFNNGYPDARFEVSVKPSNTPNQMDLTFTIQEGERQYVRRVLVSGLKISDPDLVYSRINLRSGDPLSQSNMTESQRRLYDLGVFARVDAALQNPDGEEQNKYILYRVEEARRYSVSAGFGAQLGRIGKSAVNSFESPAGTAGFSPRVSLGVSRSNFLGVAHTISLQTRISNVQRRGVLTYLAPQFKGYEDLSLSFTGLFDDSRDIQTFSAKRYEGSAQLQQRLTKANTAQYRLAYRRVTTQLAQGFLPQLVPLLAQAVTLGVVSGTFIQDRRDDPSDAKRGVYNTIDLGFASSVLGSKTSFTRALIRTSSYHRITRDIVFARALSFGAIDRISRADVPLPERFFAGGALLHRGFAENQAGPRDSDPGPESRSTGFPIGGKGLLVNTFELRFPLLGDNISGVFFHDAGNVYSTLSDVSFRTSQRDLRDFNYMVHAAGFGVRYRTPIGPMRVDLAYCVNPPAFFGLRGPVEEILKPDAMRERQRLSRFQFHFSLGQAF